MEKNIEYFDYNEMTKFSLHWIDVKLLVELIEVELHFVVMFVIMVQMVAANKYKIPMKSYKSTADTLIAMI